jgi:hypothetical protein
VYLYAGLPDARTLWLQRVTSATILGVCRMVPDGGFGGAAGWCRMVPDGPVINGLRVPFRAGSSWLSTGA